MIATCGQMQANTIAQAASVWGSVDRLAAEARKDNADLFVLPEITYPAYYLESAERYRQSDIERTPTVLERFSDLAARHKFWLIAGLVEEDGDQLYNSAAVFDRAGRLVGIARKNFLWDCDHDWFTAGDQLSVFDTEFGRLGVMICADARMPEIPATLANDGAELIVQPTAWVNTSKVRRTYRNIQPEFLIRARAMEFGVPLLCCSKAGREGTVLEYVGQSQIVDPRGRVVAQAPLGGEHVVVGEVTPTKPCSRKIDESMQERLLSKNPPYRPAQTTKPSMVPLLNDIETIAAVLQGRGVRMARLATADLAGFAPARCHALDGAQLLLVKGLVADDALVRTRAAENRVFAIVASDTAHLVIDPDGTIVWRRADWPNELELDWAQADVKQFNTRTHLWAQRRVECYRLKPPPQ